MIHDLSAAELADIRRLLLRGADTDKEIQDAERYASTIAMALGERDYIAKSEAAWRRAFESFADRAAEILGFSSIRAKAGIEARAPV